MFNDSRYEVARSVRKKHPNINNAYGNVSQDSSNVSSCCDSLMQFLSLAAGGRACPSIAMKKFLNAFDAAGPQPFPVQQCGPTGKWDFSISKISFLIFWNCKRFPGIFKLSRISLIF